MFRTMTGVRIKTWQVSMCTHDPQKTLVHYSVTNIKKERICLLLTSIQSNNIGSFQKEKMMIPSKTIIHTELNKVNSHFLQGGVGLVQDIRFSNIQVSEVQTPIVIDQFYCDKSTCRNQTSAVAVSGVQYENIRGTFTIKPVHFACSDSLPCSGISLTGVQLRPVQIPHYHLNNPFCWQAFGKLYTPTVPPIACLQIGKPAGNNLQSYHDIC
uniref:Polygalacturonase n=1 Tax=Arundo donax TaxID=35708 RepID=A0A0A9D248_ARUDO